MPIWNWAGTAPGMPAPRNSMKSFFKKPATKIWVAVLIAIIAVAVVTGIFVLLHLRAVRLAAAAAGKPIQIAGTVEPADTVDLSFGTGGPVVKVTKIIGDRVSAGEVIAEVENSALKAEYSQGQALVAGQKAKLAVLESSTSSVAIDLAEAQVSKDSDAITNDTNDLVSVLAEDYSVADDSIHDKVDDFFTSPYAANPQLAFTDTDPSASTLESGRAEVEDRLSDLQSLASAATTSIASTSPAAVSNSVISGVSDSVKDDLAEIKLFLDNVALTVNALTPDSSDVSQSTIDTWKSDLSTARANIDDSITATLATDDKLQTAEDNLAVDQQQLVSDQDVNVSAEIASQKAAIEQAEAEVQKVNALLAETYIISPIDGLVTRQDARLGQNAEAGTTLVSIESDSKFQIAATVPANEAGRITVGENANVQLDAYGPNVIFGAVVVGVSPTETAGQETTTLQFEVSDNRIKSGMSAAVTLPVVDK